MNNPPLKLFMKEYGKAAIRCLKQYLEVDTIELKMGFLNRAEQHFNEALLVNWNKVNKFK